MIEIVVPLVQAVLGATGLFAIWVLFLVWKNGVFDKKGPEWE